MTPRPKHATASVYLFCPTGTGWRIGLVIHPRFARWMLPGGHVEAHENPAEAALREVTEETGIAATLVPWPGPGEPEGTDEPPVPVPLWIVEQQVPPEEREPVDHVHIDHLYLATAPRPAVPDVAELRFAWFTNDDLDGLDMFTDTRARARHLFARLSDPLDPLAPALGDHPALPGEDLVLPGQNPALPGQNPALPGQDPAVPGQNPALPGQDPAVPGEDLVLPREDLRTTCP